MFEQLRPCVMARQRPADCARMGAGIGVPSGFTTFQQRKVKDFTAGNGLHKVVQPVFVEIQGILQEVVT